MPPLRAVVLLLAGLLGPPVFTGCANMGSLKYSSPAAYNGVFVEVTGTVMQGFSTVGLVGTAVNQTGRDLKMCVIYLDILDKEGTKIGEALASTSGLTVGQKWKFQAYLSGTIGTYMSEVRVSRVMVM